MLQCDQHKLSRGVATIDKLKCAGTVWLYGDEHNHPGLLGFLTSARKEFKGDRLRAIAAWGEDSDNIDYDGLVERALELDLISNVYQAGVHGSYAPVLTQVLTMLSHKVPLTSSTHKLQ